MRVAGTEAQRLLDVRLGLLGLAEVTLCVADLGVRAGQISIQLQRPLARPYALRGAVGMHLDHAQEQMGERILGSQGQRRGQSGLGGGEPRGSIVDQEASPTWMSTDGKADRAPNTLAGSSAAARSNKRRACARLSGVKPLFSLAQP